jgi:hypothetical protein
LMATKRQYFLAVFVPIVAMLAVRTPPKWSAGWLRWPAWLTLPALAGYLATEPFLRAAPGGGGVCRIAGGLSEAKRLGGAHVAHYLSHGVSTTFEGAFLPGSGLESFWLAYTAYRNTLLVLGSPAVTQAATVVIPALSLIVALLFAVRLVRVAPRLATVARRRSWRSAARVVTSNVLVNAYLCYFAILLGYEISIGGYIPVQGRYWLPFVSGVWLIAVVIAPRALPRRWARAFGGVILTLILAFDVVASASTFPSLHDRFYAPRRAALTPEREVLADVVATPGASGISVRGVAVDLRDAAPVERVVLRLDDQTDVTARSVPRPDVLCNMEQTLLQTGFEANVSKHELAAGRHDIVVLVKTPWSARLIDTGARSSFEVR